MESDDDISNISIEHSYKTEDANNLFLKLTQDEFKKLFYEKLQKISDNVPIDNLKKNTQ